MSFQEEFQILLADDDQQLCSAVSRYLKKTGYRILQAHDGFRALKLIEKHKPNLIILDLKMPGLDGLELIEIAEKKTDFIAPIIITTGNPELTTAIKAIQHGAYDYIIKPYQFQVLEQKINQALKSSRLARENVVLNELVSLYELTSKLTTTHNLDQLLDIIFKYCIDISKAASGTLQLFDSENNELVIVRHASFQSDLLRSPVKDSSQWPVSKQVFLNGRSLLVTDGKAGPESDLCLNKSDYYSMISVPLRVSGETIGVINLCRNRDSEHFTLVDLNMIDVLASQAGIAVNNANLYASINQKLDELMLISTYSEQLMGLVDKNDIIRCLFEIVVRHFPIDFLGFLVVQKRMHEFIYWSAMDVDEILTRDVLKETVESYNKFAPAGIQEKRVHINQLFLKTVSRQKYDKKEQKLSFRYTVPVCWEDFRYGVVFFGSVKEQQTVSEKKTLLSSLVSQTRIALTNSKLYSDMKENYIRTIKALAIAVDAKDTYTHGHSENVMNIAEEISREMNIEEKITGIIRDAGLLHDIGKIGIPGYILNKPGPLTYEEFNGIMKTHSTLGANIVKDVPFLRDLHKLILHHHEHYDGGGYPDGLKAEQIPIGARILHVADAFEAMTSNRPYRSSLGQKEAIRRLVEGSGKQFDPDVISAFLRIARKKGWLDEIV